MTEKAMAPHSSTLAWKILWTEEPGRLQSIGLLGVRQDWVSSLSPFHFHALEKEMAIHSSTLVWRIPGMGEPGGLPSMGVAQSQTRLKQLSSSSSRTGKWSPKKLECWDHLKKNFSSSIFFLGLSELIVAHIKINFWDLGDL